jgi:hypothetical protein
MIPDLKDTYRKYSDLIHQRKVHFLELVFTKRISKNSEGYYSSKRNTVESCYQYSF